MADQVPVVNLSLHGLEKMYICGKKSLKADAKNLSYNIFISHPISGDHIEWQDIFQFSFFCYFNALFRLGFNRFNRNYMCSLYHCIDFANKARDAGKSHWLILCMRYASSGVSAFTSIASLIAAMSSGTCAS